MEPFARQLAHCCSPELLSPSLSKDYLDIGSCWNRLLGGWDIAAAPSYSLPPSLKSVWNYVGAAGTVCAAAGALLQPRAALSLPL